MLLHVFKPSLSLQEKHIVICQKLKDKKRKTFDSTKQRAENLDKINNCDIQLKPTQPEAQPPAKAKRTQTKAAAAAPPSPPTVSKTSNWREQHQEFVRTIRAARGEQVEPKVEQLDSEGRKVVPAGFVECSSCGRRFSERAAERHLPWCADKAKVAAQTREEDDRRLEALERQKARTKVCTLAVNFNSNVEEVSDFSSVSSIVEVLT